MPNTYVLIASTTLGSTTTPVTFSSIPQTYTDLLIRVSAKCAATGTTDLISANFNGSTANFSGNEMYNSSGTMNAWAPGGYFGSVNGAEAGNGNNFSNIEVYIPRYTVTGNKAFSAYWTNERNSTSGPFIGHVSNMWSGTAAITSITFAQSNGFIANSSFHLYGIKNS
jgi:hypothetical protein